jgi:3-hydroxyisobutyrate dehydrogenase-like beta-hydroxyacid dehydrogenase
MTRALAGDGAPLAHTTLLAKDSRLAVAMAAATGFEPKLGAHAAAAFARAVVEGHGERDDSCLLALLRGEKL